MLEGRRAPLWTVSLVRGVAEAPDLVLAGIVLDERQPGGRRPTRAVQRAFDAVDRRVFAPRSPELALTEADPVLDGLPTVGFTAARELIQRLPELELDILLSLVDCQLPSGLASCAREGLWFHRIGIAGAGRGGIPALSEFLRGDEVVGVALMRMTAAGEEAVARWWAPTDALSLRRTLNATYSSCVQATVRSLRQLEDPPPADAAAPQAPPAAPTNRDLIRFGARTTRALARRQVRRTLTREQWFIALQRSRDDLPSAATIGDVIPLLPPAGRFYADPCVFDEDERGYLFLEDFSYEEGRALISVGEIQDDGTVSAIRPVLRRPYHLSYPYVFAHEGERYLVPESAAAGQIQLFRATRFPDEWERVCVLFEGHRAVDPTIILRDGRWWMWATVALGNRLAVQHLWLFSAERLRGPWSAHPKNPVLSDVRCARPAGAPLTVGGRLFRPGQDCSGRYGRRVVFNEVLTLTAGDYSERPAATLEPSWLPGMVATHTFSRGRRWQALDGARDTSRLTRR
ncbi:MAG: hypothetical protein LC744_01870 [Chloroflexi bacterium]|nr:hypothetical protein [Chloroflexota bacterium]